MKTAKAKHAENELMTRLQIQKLKSRIDTITCDVNVRFIFYFPSSLYYTKKGARNKKLPDLSNLYELPQDVMQKLEILENDTQVVSHDGSRRVAVQGSRYFLFIELTRATEPETIADLG